MQVAGSSGVVHLSMRTNVSNYCAYTRKACEVPDLMLKKINAILREQASKDVANADSQTNALQQRKEMAEQLLHYHRVHYTMKKQCAHHLRSLVDHMDIWFSPFNNIGHPIVKDHDGTGMQMTSDFEIQKRDAKEHLKVIEAELESVDDNHRDYEYWLQKYVKGEWSNFPYATYKEMPKMLKSDAIDVALWNEIVHKIGKVISKESHLGKDTERKYLNKLENVVTQQDLGLTFNDDFSHQMNIPNSTSAVFESQLELEFIERERGKRQIFWFLTTAAIAIGSLIYNALEMNNLATTANANQQVTIQNLNSLDHRMAIQEKAMHLLNRSVDILQEDIVELDKRVTVDEIVLECHITLDLFYGELERVIRGLSAMSRNELSVDLVNITGLTNNLMILRDRMENRGYILGLEKLEHLFVQPISYILYGNGSLVVFSHINAYRKASIYELWEYNKVPFLSPTAEGDVALTIVPEADLIGVTEDDARHILFDFNTIEKCNSVGSIKICDEANVISTKTRTSCMSSLLLKDVDAIKETCRWHSSERKEFIQQINSNQFIAYFAKPDSLKIVCSDGQLTVNKRIEVDSAVKITLQGGCRAYSDHHIMEGRLEFSIETSLYQLIPINTTQLLSTVYFTITPDKWNTWKKIKRAIGNPEGVLFKDVGPMYQKYEENAAWTQGLKIFMGIASPVIMGTIIWFAKDWILGMILKRCGRTSEVEGSATYQPGGSVNFLGLLAQGLSQTRGASARSESTQRHTPTPTPRSSPPRTPQTASSSTRPSSSSAKATSNTKAVDFKETTYIFDPTSNVRDWPSKFKQEIQASAAKINAIEKPNEIEIDMSELKKLEELENMIPMCRVCVKPVLTECRCQKKNNLDNYENEDDP